ncbi:MAG: GNAT family protein [Propionibacteriaceae bacterium]|nr:GNAT family protein [Propionibacteriaceae bacterium]
MIPTEVPTLTGRLVVLREWCDADAPLIASVASDPLIPLITSVPSSGLPDDIAAYLHRQRRRPIDGTGLSFAITDLRTTRAIGSIGLWTRDYDRGRLSIGYWVAKEFRHQGRAQDALATLTRWAAMLPGVGRLQLFVEPWNEGSWRIAEACGFMREGLLRQWQQVGGRRRDMWVYSLIPDPDDLP